MRVVVTSAPIEPASELAGFTKTASTSGGIVSFTGQVRNEAGKEKVKKLHLQSHPVMTEAGILKAAEQIQQRFQTNALTVLHRTGDIKAGETIVFVAAAADHRRAAFEAADFMMDYLKTEAIFWKKEIRETGYEWIEPRDQDYTDQARWEQLGE